ncbi:MAG: hypothetical protein ACUVR3_09910 [Candidatus Roseilinea sp.]|uniref:hypothetical protein n=1 Tax=Candidatus Roseilinea sp. TaxID=2838777 RepID=UPI00404AC667
MNAIQILRSLGPIDARSVLRDTLLRWILLMPLLFAPLLRWGVPALTTWLQQQAGFDLTPHYPLIMSSMVMMMPALVGTVIGFLLLDQRDDQTLVALQVTPMTLPGYLAYRIAVPMFLSMIMVVAIVVAADLTPLDPGALLMSAVAAAPMAPLYALALAVLAENKVQGFALSKASGVFMMPALLAYFVPAEWQLVLGLSPVTWTARLFWALAAGDPAALIYFVVGLVYQALLIGLLLRRFTVVMTR